MASINYSQDDEGEGGLASGEAGTGVESKRYKPVKEFAMSSVTKLMIQGDQPSV